MPASARYEVLIDDVAFENLRIGGRLIRSAGEMNLQTNEFVKKLRFVVHGKGTG